MAINSLSYQSNGLAGMVSGMDTESMVKKLLSGTQARIDSQKQKKTTLENKQTLYREVATKLKTLQSDYFSFNNPTTNLFSDALFNNMKATSSSSAVKVTAGSNAAVGSVRIDSVNQLATATTTTSSAVVSSTLRGAFSSTAAQAFADGISNESLTFTMQDGTSAVVNVAALAGKSNAESVQILNDAFATAGLDLTASYENGKFSISTNTVGDADNSQKYSVTASSTTAASLLGYDATTVYSADSGKLDVTLDTEALLPSFNLSLDGGAAKTVSYNIFDGSGNVITDPNQIAANINESLSRVVGSAVQVSVDGGNLVFGTFKGDGSEDVSRQIVINGSAENMNILGITSGSSNKINTGKSLRDANFSTALLGDSFDFTINGVDFSFNQDTTIANVMNTVNNSKANVKMSYSAVEDKFTIQSTVTGAGGQVDMEQTSGNLLTAMFGDTAQEVNLFGNDTTVNKNAKLADLGLTTDGKMNIKVGSETLELDFGENATVEQMGTELQTKVREAAAAKGIVELTDFELQQFNDGPPPTFRVAGVNLPIRFYKKDGGTEVVAAEVAPQFGTRTEGQNAIATINGARVERNTNNFTYEGLTFELQKTTAAGDSPIAVETTRDTTQAFDAIKKFVTAYNETNTYMHKLLTEDASFRDYPPLTDAQKDELSDKEIERWEAKSKEGLLRSDSLLQRIQGQMRSSIYQKSDTSDLALYSIGIDTSYNTTTPGNLVLDETKLQQMLSQDPEGVRKLFTDANTGISARLNQVIDSAAKVSSASPGSLYTMAGAAGVNDTTSTIYFQIKNINTNLTELASKYDKEYDRYWAQFNNMETQLANLSNQSSWLAQQFSGTS